MPNSLYTGTASDWANMFKEYSTTEGGISLWEQALTSLQQTADIQAQAVQASADYDISQAYANYLQSQRQIAQASNLGTGFKEQLESNLQSSYQSAFGQAETEEAQGLYDVAQTYQEGVTNLENQATEIGETLSGLSNRVFEYLETYGSAVPGYEKINWAGNLEEQGVYTRDENNNLVLTEKGSNALSYALLNRLPIDETSSISFEEWLGNTYSDDLETYRQNYDILRSGFGIAPGTTALDTEQYESSTERIYLDEISEKAQSYVNYFDSNSYNSAYSNKNENNARYINEIKSGLETILNIPENTISYDVDSTGRWVMVNIDVDDLSKYDKSLLEKQGAKESNGIMSIRIGMKKEGDISAKEFFNNIMINAPKHTINKNGSGGGGRF